MNTDNILDKLQQSSTNYLRKTEEEKYEKTKLNFNPFPKSGAANINGSDFYNANLSPFNDNVISDILRYVENSLSLNVEDPDDKLYSLIITGNYGSGKTQLLLYIKYILNLIYEDKKINRKPFVIYIDNPGSKVSELIGSIVLKIGEENFRKFLWNSIIVKLNEDKFKSELNKYNRASTSSSIFALDESLDPFSINNTVNYRQFLNCWYKLVLPRDKKDFEGLLKSFIIQILKEEFGQTNIATYFFEIVSNDLGNNKAWDELVSGNMKADKKESIILQAIVRLVKEQGFTNFFILVDEFEDITLNRISKAQFDNYLANLRTLLDDRREWCLAFAMTGDALESIKKASPPLFDRIATQQVNLVKMNDNEAINVAKRYIGFAQKNEEDNALFPFNEKAISAINDFSEGVIRTFVKICYLLIEEFIKTGSDIQIIDKDFVNKNLQQN